MRLADCLRLARPRQWSKNLLLLAGVLFSGRFMDGGSLMLAGLAFVAFVLLSSSVYAFNDLRDAAADRRHPLKKHRPIAARRISPGQGAVLAALWAGAGLGVSAMLGAYFLALALAYLGLSTLYSQWTKHQVILDVLSLAAGFVLRAAAGAVAVGVPISEWLLVCTTLLALFMGLVKRRAELQQMIAVVAGSTVVAYALYAVSAHPAGRASWMMLTIPFVLYGIFRYLYLAHQKGLGAAPEQVLLGDRALQVDLGLWVLASAGILMISKP
jgi:4-hydroxybenzoate polyprenyltransferase